MSFQELRTYVNRMSPSMADRSDAAVRALLGLLDTENAITPLFTSYQLLAFEANIHPYAVQPDDPKDVLRWQ
jgi:hypothetical protein